MTYRQKKIQVNSALRKFKKSYRSSDTMGERLERELTRLINRKELVEPQSLRKTVELVRAYASLTQVLIKLVGDVITIATA